MSAAATPAINLTLSAEAAAQLRASMRLTAEEIDLIATCVAAKLRDAPSALTLRQMAEKYGRSVSYMHEQVLAGKLRTVRPGGTGDKTVLPADELAWLRGEVTAKPGKGK